MMVIIIINMPLLEKVYELFPRMKERIKQIDGLCKQRQKTCYLMPDTHPQDAGVDIVREYDYWRHKESVVDEEPRGFIVYETIRAIQEGE